MNLLYFKCPENEYKKEQLEHNFQQWLMSSEMQELVKAFGGNIPQTNNLTELAKWMLEFSDIWDYRKKQTSHTTVEGKEHARWLVQSNEINPYQVETVEKVIAALGLTGNTVPSLKSYDYVCVLGGARLSCLLRGKYAPIIAKRLVEVPKAFFLLSGMRPINSSEKSSTESYAPNAETEFDLMNRAGEIAFNLSGRYEEERYDDENQNKSWAIRSYDTNEAYKVISLSAPSSEADRRRANSADTFHFLVEKYNLCRGTRLLLITSEIYVPYQQLEAIRIMGMRHNLYVETVGYPNEWAQDMQGMRGAANYLQEIRSTIQSMNRIIDKE